MKAATQQFTAVYNRLGYFYKAFFNAENVMLG